MGDRELSEYGLLQPHTVDNDRFAKVYCREIDYNQGEQEAYVKCNYLYSLPISERCTTALVQRSMVMRVVCYFWMLQVEYVSSC